MTDKVVITDSFLFDSAEYETTQSAEKKGVLRTLKGPLAEWGGTNRNRRRYSEKLWEKVLESSYVQEQMRYNTLLGEANHPQDRFEVDFGRVSHCITDMKKVPERKQIHGTIDILNTPLGRILNVLYEYGSVLGVSSRAGGTLTDKREYVEVDEDTYQFITFDIVPYPSVESARLISEGTNLEETQKYKLSDNAKKELRKILESASLDDKKILKDFIYELSNSYSLDEEISILEGIDDIQDKDGGKEIKDTTLCLLKDSYRLNRSLTDENERVKREFKNLQESMNTLKDNLTKISQERDRYKNLSEELKRKSNTGSMVVRDTFPKFEDYESELEVLKAENAMLSEQVGSLRAVVKNYKGSDREKEELTQKLDEMTKQLKETTSALSEVEVELGQAVGEVRSLTEAKEGAAKLVRRYKKELETLRERYSRVNEEKERLGEEVELLKESLSQVKARSLEQIKSFNQQIEFTKSGYSEEVSKLQKAVNESEMRTDTYKKAIESYKRDLVKMVSGHYGVDEKSVLSMLKDKEVVSLDEIYMVCESMSTNRGTEIIAEVIESGVSEREVMGKKDRLGHIVNASRRGL